MKPQWTKYDNLRFNQAFWLKVPYKDDNHTLRLVVWKDSGKWRYGAINWVDWGAVKTRAEAQRRAVSTCIKLCVNAVKVLNQLRPQDAGR